AEFCALRKSVREFQGHGCPRPTSSSSVGNFAPRFETKLTSLGKLSSNGPRRPFGYQIKWPMPSEAKSSPWFHEVSPEIVPLHSFCHTLLPIFKASLCETVIEAAVFGQSAMMPVASKANARSGCPKTW